MTEVTIVRGWAYLFMQNVVVNILYLISFVFVARILTKTEMGVLVALTLILTLARLFSDLGFSNALTKYISEYIGKKQDHTSLILAGLSFKASLAAMIAIACFLTAPLISQALLKTQEYLILFGILSIEIIFTCLTETMKYILLGLKKMREMAIFSIVATAIQNVAALSLLFAGWGLMGYLIGSFIGDFIYTALSFSIFLKGNHIRVCTFNEIRKRITLLGNFSWPLFLSNLASFLYGWFDRTILIIYVPLSEVAVYNVAYTAFSVLLAVPFAISFSLFPYYGELYGKNQNQTITTSVYKASRYMALLYVPLALGMGSTAYSTLTLFAGDQYASGYIVLAILSFFSIILGIKMVLEGLLLVYNKTSTILFIDSASIIVSLLLSFVIFPYAGAVGMAMVRAVAMIISFALVFWNVQKIMQIRIDQKAIGKSLVSGIAMVAIIKAIEIFWNGIYPVLIVTGGITYLLMLKKTKAVNEEDLKFVRMFLGKKLNFVTNFLEFIYKT